MSLFLKLPVTSSNLELPIVPPQDIESFSQLEVEAYAHWIFDRGSQSLTSVINPRQLTVQNTAPTYETNYLRMPSPNGNALITDYADAAISADTMCAVVRWPVALTVPLVTMGNLGSGAINNGFGPFVGIGGDDMNWQARGPSLPYATGGGSSEFGVGAISPNNWYFIAAARDWDSPKFNAVRYIGGIYSQEHLVSQASTYNPGPNLALGQSQLGTSPQELQVAEFVLFDQYLTPAEIDAVFTRAIARMALRGITITTS